MTKYNYGEVPPSLPSNDKDIENFFIDQWANEYHYAQQDNNACPFNDEPSLEALNMPAHEQAAFNQWAQSYDYYQGANNQPANYSDYDYGYDYGYDYEIEDYFLDAHPSFLDVHPQHDIQSVNQQENIQSNTQVDVQSYQLQDDVEVDDCDDELQDVSSFDNSLVTQEDDTEEHNSSLTAVEEPLDELVVKELNSNTNLTSTLWRNIIDYAAISMACTFFPVDVNKEDSLQTKINIESLLKRASEYVYGDLFPELIKQFYQDVYNAHHSSGEKNANDQLVHFIHTFVHNRFLKLINSRDYRLSDSAKVNLMHYAGEISRKAYMLPQGEGLMQLVRNLVYNMQVDYNKHCVNTAHKDFFENVNNGNKNAVDVFVKQVNSLANSSPTDWIGKAKFDNLIKSTKQYYYEESQKEDFKFNIKEFDDLLTNGFRRGEMMVLGAPAGHGKTAILVNMLYRYLSGHKPDGGGKAIFFSLEVSAFDIYTRLLKLHISRHLDKKDHADITDKNIIDLVINNSGPLATTKIRSAIAEFEHSAKYKNLVIYDSTFLEGLDVCNIDVIEDLIKQEYIDSNGNIAFVAIDYIQFIYEEDEKGTYQSSGALRHEMIASISKKLVALKKRYKLRLVLLSSLNSAEYSIDKMPTIDHIKDCKQIGYDADIVITMLKYNNDFNPDVSTLVAKVVKARNSRSEITTLMSFTGSAFKIGFFNVKDYIEDYCNKYGIDYNKFNPQLPIDRDVFEKSHKFSNNNRVIKMPLNAPHNPHFMPHGNVPTNGHFNNQAVNRNFNGQQPPFNNNNNQLNNNSNQVNNNQVNTAQQQGKRG